jgi:hypothetical protein
VCNVVIMGLCWLAVAYCLTCDIDLRHVMHLKILKQCINCIACLVHVSVLFLVYDASAR